MATVATDKLLTGSVLEEQIRLETQAVQEGVARYNKLAREAIERGEGANLKPAERLLLHWYRPLVQAIRQEQRAVRRGDEHQDRAIYGPVILMLDATRLAVVTMHEAVSSCMSEPAGVPLTRLGHAVGRAVLAEVNLDLLKSKNREAMKELERRMKRRSPMRVNWWAKKTLDDPAWNLRVCAKLGVAMLWQLISVASAGGYDEDTFTPAFVHGKKWAKPNKSIATLRLSEAAFDVIADGHDLRKHLRPRYLPMVVEPYPWQHQTEGGYARIRTPFISKPRPGQKAALREASVAGQMDQVYECLSAVSSTPWRINTRILDVAKRIWQGGGGAAKVPLRENPPMPPKVVSQDAKRIAENKAARKKVWERKVALRSQRKEFLNKVGIAEDMADRDAIWFPHQFDFRGRCYPIPAHLNHQGDDLCRGLLEFADGKPVGSLGRFWMLVHMANCCGVDKLAYKARALWAQQNMDVFRGWAEDPVGNTGWMLKLDGEPDEKHAWQKLAAAFALFDDEAASHLPIQLDGTCNGLQHYAAIGRDVDGAATVNMLPADQPNDIYSIVAGEVQTLMRQAAGQRGEARCLVDLIERDLVKQPVMTSVYGVTQVGARKQMHKKLGAISDDDQRYKASMYLSRVTLEALETLCTGATRTMEWLRACARQIAKAGEPVRWTTPIGLPVVQPYRKWRSVRVKTLMHELTMRVEDDDVPIAVKRQINGCPPNWIHSIDSTHMLLTAREMRRRGLAFSAVHDSYWTHAADVDLMASVIREQFIALHKRPLLTELFDEFTDRYQMDFPAPPETGTFDVELVREAPYFFS